jgi:hypothetical protein
MHSIDATTGAVAFPNPIKEFHAPGMHAAWTISIYYIAMTMLLPLAANSSDSSGKKRIFLVCLILFALDLSAEKYRAKAKEIQIVLPGQSRICRRRISVGLQRCFRRREPSFLV